MQSVRAGQSTGRIGTACPDLVRTGTHLDGVHTDLKNVRYEIWVPGPTHMVAGVQVL
jgi:hypothetical protein